MKYIDMRKFISQEVNWDHEHFPIVAQFFGTSKLEIEGKKFSGLWELPDNCIVEFNLEKK